MIQKLDLYSSGFKFFIGDQYNKGTRFGFFITLLVCVTTTVYAIYTFNLFLTNQIEPNFRSQNFISSSAIDLQLTNDLVSFKYDYGNNTSIFEAQKTYFIFYAFFFYQNETTSLSIMLDIIECSQPNLVGYYCLDYQKLVNTTLILDSLNNISSQIQIFTYGCLDVDSIKTSVPNNCASQQEIDKMANGKNSGLKIKLYSSQYNTQTQQIQANYRNIMIYTDASQHILTKIKTQKQITQIKQGMILQNQSSFSSPISFEEQSSSMDRQYAFQNVGVGSYSIVFVYLDEIVQQNQIQYTTLPQILTLINGVFSLLGILGILGRSYSESSIRKDFFFLLLQNLYQDTYNYISKSVELIRQDTVSEKPTNEIQKSQEDQDNYTEEKQDEPNLGISIPAFLNKSKFYLEADYPIEDFSNLKQNNLQNQKYQNLSTEQSIFSPKNSLIKSKIQSKEIEKTNILPQLNKNAMKKSETKYSQSQQQIFQVQQQKRNSHQKISQSQPSKQNQNINVKEQLQKFQALKNKQIENKLQQIISKPKFFNKKAQQDTLKLSSEQINLIEQQVKQDLNIFNIFKEIIFLKKAIMLILSQDQLAILQLVGASSNILNLDLKNVDQIQFEQLLNHYEQQQMVQKSEYLQEYYIKKFFDRCSSEQELNDFDKRILKSLNSQYQK